MGALKTKIEVDAKNGIAGVNAFKSSLFGLSKISEQTKRDIDLLAHSTQFLSGVFKSTSWINNQVKSLIQANAQYEKMRTQLTGFVAVNVKNIDSLGKSLNATAKWSLSAKEADRILSELTKTGKKTKFSIDDIAQGFSMFYATAANQGSVDKAIKAFSAISQAANATGQDLKSLTPMFDSLATGKVLANSSMGSFMKMVNLTNEELKKANENGKVFDLLIEKLGKYKDLSAASADSFDALSANLKNTFGELQLAASKPFFELATASLKTFDNFLQENKEVILSYIQTLSSLAINIPLAFVAFKALGATFISLKGAASLAKIGIMAFSNKMAFAITGAILFKRANTALIPVIIRLKNLMKTFLPLAAMHSVLEFINLQRRLNDETDKNIIKISKFELYTTTLGQSISDTAKIIYEGVLGLTDGFLAFGGIVLTGLSEIVSNIANTLLAPINLAIKAINEFRDDQIAELKIDLVDLSNLDKFTLNSIDSAKEHMSNIGKIFDDAYNGESLVAKIQARNAKILAEQQKQGENLSKIVYNNQKIISSAQKVISKDKQVAYELAQKRSELMFDEVQKEQYLINLRNGHDIEQYEAMYKKGEITAKTYNEAMSLEEELHQKRLFDASSFGRIMQSSLNGLENALGQFFDYSSKRFMDFGALGKTILNELANEMIKMMIIKPAVNALSGYLNENFATPSAQGNVFSSPNLHQYANKIVTKPTYFAFANGGVPRLGIMGEKNGASPEAIMPLTRMSNGDLGVKSANNMKIEIINQTKEDAKISNVESFSNLEEKVISIVINAAQTNKGGMRDALGN